MQLNAGLEAKPLARVASGGELSRLMLALKVVLARHDAIPTLVFDEVDQGIGGEVGAQVGGALAEVAERHQVLVITHLPQIAARADRHLVVSKEAAGRHRHQRRAGDPRRGSGGRARADAGRHRGRSRAAPRAGAAPQGEGGPPLGLAAGGPVCLSVSAISIPVRLAPATHRSGHDEPAREPSEDGERSRSSPPPAKS